MRRPPPSRGQRWIGSLILHRLTNAAVRNRTPPGVVSNGNSPGHKKVNDVVRLQRRIYFAFPISLVYLLSPPYLSIICCTVPVCIGSGGRHCLGGYTSAPGGGKVIVQSVILRWLILSSARNVTGTRRNWEDGAGSEMGLMMMKRASNAPQVP